MKSPLLLALGAILVAAVIWWVPPGGAQKRVLSDYRVDQWPSGFPEEWKRDLHLALENAPDLSLHDVQAESAAAELVSQVAWVLPGSVQVERALPDGLRVSYAPRLPRVLLIRNGHRLGILDRMGVVLPDGPAESYLSQLITVLAPEDFELPACGETVREPFLQSALDATAIAYNFRSIGLAPVVGIIPWPGYPTQSPGVSHPVSFTLAGGCRVDWGRVGPLGPLDLDTETRLQRVAQAIRIRPRLEGVQSIDVGSRKMKMFDLQGQPIPLTLSQ